MSAPAAPAAAAGGDAPKKSKKKLFIIIGAVAFLLIAGGGGAAFFMMKQKAAAEAAAAAAEEEEDEQPKKSKAKGDNKAKKKKKTKTAKEGSVLEFYPVDPWFTFNLQDKDPERTGQIGLVYEITDKKSLDELKLKFPIIRSRIILLLTSKLSQEIKPVEGKQKLADEILELTREVLEDSGEGVAAVHFQIFVVQ